jgi:hypothetical protein
MVFTLGCPLRHSFNVCFLGVIRPLREGTPMLSMIAKSFARSVVGKPTVANGKIKVIPGAVFILSCFFVAAFSQAALAQSALNSYSGVELPVVMRKKIVAGVTPVGTVVQANLAVATLVDGVVVPENAILSGEVTESAAKSATDPSRLAIRMDSARWKIHGSSQVLKLIHQVYLTAWSYPTTSTPFPDLGYQAPDLTSAQRSRSRLASYPGTPPGQRPQGPDDGSDSPASTTQPAPTTTSSAAPHRVLIKDVESTRARDGAVALTSRHSTIKLDKSTTYVFAGGGLAGGPV